jgi:hypothetical protein
MATPAPLPRDVLIEDFRQQCAALQGQYARMHGRLQLVTGLNTTLLPVLGTVGLATGRGEVGRAWLVFFPLSGLLLSLIGFLVGRNDRWLVTLYRAQLARSAKLILAAGDTDLTSAYPGWLHTGRDPAEVGRMLVDRDTGRPWWDRLLSGRWAPMSATRLPGFLSLTFAVVWLVVAVVLVLTA